MSKEVKLVTVRVLSDFPHEGQNYKPNQLVSISDAVVTRFKKAGVVDDSKEAIEYCKKELGVEVIERVALGDASIADLPASESTEGGN